MKNRKLRTPRPKILKPTTKDKNAALRAVMGMWKDREDMKTDEDVRNYRATLWGVNRFKE